MDFKKRPAVSRSAMESLSNMWKSQGIYCIRRPKFSCWRLLCGQMQHTDVKNGNSIARVSWIHRKTNEWVLDALNEKRYCCKEWRDKRYVVRRCAEKKQLSTENITRVLCQWNKISRKTKKKMEWKWIENITEWIGLKINEAVRITKDRHRGHNVPLTANALGGRH